jgi:hypothetical protein
MGENRMCVDEENMEKAANEQSSLTLEQGLSILAISAAILRAADDLLHAPLPPVPQEFLSPDDPRRIGRIPEHESAQIDPKVSEHPEPVGQEACGPIFPNLAG